MKKIIFIILLFSLLSCKKDENDDNNNNNYNTTVNVPSLITNSVNSITFTSVIIGCKIICDGGAAVTECGVCWDTVQWATPDDNKITGSVVAGNYSCSITGLTPNTTYYIRAYAINSAGTGYGIERIVRTYYNTITDIDGNTYNTVMIGSQEWMAQNLNTTTYRNGNPIPFVPDDDSQWDALTTGAYCNKENSSSNASVYGRLYNWYAVNDGRNIAPSGWHVPTDADWEILENYLGGRNECGGKMKEIGTLHWISPNTGAENSSGFTGLPGGSRPEGGGITAIGVSANWWSKSDSNSTYAFARHADIYGAYLMRYYAYKGKVGFSVRCVKD